MPRVTPVPRTIWLLGCALIGVAVLLRALYAVPWPWETVRRWFDLDAEHAIPVWVASMQLAAAAAAAGYCGWAERRRGRSGWGWWVLIGAAFGYLSLDETAQLHEPIGAWFGERLSITVFRNEAYAWLLAFMPAIVFGSFGLGVFLWKRLRRHPQALAWAGAGFLCWLGALGCETWQGLVPRALYDTAMKHMIVGWEETFELIGAACFLTGFLWYAVILRDERWRRPGT